jgi:hypothetical protein
MSDKALITLLRGIAAFLIAMPGTLQLVPDLAMTPVVNAVLLLGALAGATLMSQLPPAGTAAREDGTEVDQLIDRLEALPKEAREELSSRLEWRARLRGEAD